MEAGRLDRRITLYRPDFTRDAMNEPVAGWAQVPAGRTIAARKLDISDGERLKAQQVGASVTSRFHIRRASEWAGIDSTWQIDHEGQRFNITGVKELLSHGDHGRRVGHEITAVAQADPPPAGDTP